MNVPMDTDSLNQTLDQIEELIAHGYPDEGLARLQELYSATMPSSLRGRALALEVVGLEEQERFQEANRLIEMTMKEDGDDLGFILAAGVQFSELDAVEQAEIFLKNLCQLDSENHLAWFNLGVALSRAGRHEEALHAYEQTLKRAPDFNEAHLHAAYALRMEDKREESLERYRQYTALEPEDVDGWIGYAQLLSELGRHAEALESFQRLEKLQPDSLDLYFDWAVSAARAKEESTVAACVQRMIEIDPEDWRTLLTQADFEETLGNVWQAWERLCGAFEDVADTEEEDPEAFDFVASTLLRFAARNRMQENAAEYVEEMFTFEPLSEDVLDALLMLNERYSNASSSFQVVLKGTAADDTGHLQVAYRVYGVAAEEPEQAGLLALAFEERCTGSAWQVFNIMQISPPDEGSIGVYWMSDLLSRPPSATPERG